MQSFARLGLAALFLFSACETDAGDDDRTVVPGGPGGSIPGAGGPGVDAGGGGGGGGSQDARNFDAGFDAIGPADSPAVPDSPLVPDAPQL
ncbi:MAG TPA: hypothetical protein VGM88_28825 [Kofleriaceae bacterium]|jgi:hypothetical protein